MDMRRAARPPQSSRRLFAPSRRQHTANMSSTSSLSTLHIPAEEADPKDDIVEKDPDGVYVMVAPKVNLESEPDWVDATDTTEDDQIKEVISMYGIKGHPYWDQESGQQEIRDAMKESLKKKFEGLEADRWMFEGDAKNRG